MPAKFWLSLFAGKYSEWCMGLQIKMWWNIIFWSFLFSSGNLEWNMCNMFMCEIRLWWLSMSDNISLCSCYQSAISDMTIPVINTYHSNIVQHSTILSNYKWKLNIEIESQVSSQDVKFEINGMTRIMSCGNDILFTSNIKILNMNMCVGISIGKYWCLNKCLHFCLKYSSSSLHFSACVFSGFKVYLIWQQSWSDSGFITTISAAWWHWSRHLAWENK